MKRRIFIRKTAFAGLSGMLMPYISLPQDSKQGELLYNGIQLPEIWPPKNMDPAAYRPMPVPYLLSPPKVIPIDVGRQLFVDDFLIAETNLKRKFHKAKKIDTNPVFKAATKLEEGPYGIPGAAPKDGGVWWDPKEKIFKMWYEAGWVYTMAYAVSRDGIKWERPDLDIEPGTNRLVPELITDSTTVFLDHFTSNPKERFKMFIRPPGAKPRGNSLVSPDGIHWSEPVKTGVCGDRSTMFYNPFRKKWIYSVRSTGEIANIPIGRARYYREHSDFLEGAAWRPDELVFWTGADCLDLPDPIIGEKPQLYNLSAVGYESIMLGLHEIHLGPPNEECAKEGTPKITELMLSYSRDGFHWSRPDREAFIPATRKPGDWDRGYVQSAGGICTIVGDQLRFYYIGYRGDQQNLNPNGMRNGMYANGSTGIAVLRRDGFISMSAENTEGWLITRPVTFKGRYLFVNIDCPKGELRVEMLNEDNTIILPFSSANCIPVTEDSTIRYVSWKNVKDLSNLAGKRVRFRFNLKNAHLYSFWISPDKSGASYGYVAAGGPGYTGGIDNMGTKAYKKAASFNKLQTLL